MEPYPITRVDSNIRFRWENLLKEVEIFWKTDFYCFRLWSWFWLWPANTSSRRWIESSTMSSQAFKPSSHFAKWAPQEKCGTISCVFWPKNKSFKFRKYNQDWVLFSVHVQHQWMCLIFVNQIHQYFHLDHLDLAPNLNILRQKYYPQKREKFTQSPTFKKRGRAYKDVSSAEDCHGSFGGRRRGSWLRLHQQVPLSIKHKTP